MLLCFGTRPEAIKMAPVIKELKKQQVAFKVCITGQHSSMLKQVLDFFEIEVDYDLQVMRVNQSLNSLSAEILNSFDPILEIEKPSWVLVHGDTTTSVMAALAAFNRRIPVAHIEAGLRTYDKTSPFPEEMNRQLTSRIADLHFSPTKQAVFNLRQEGLSEEKIHLTGNTIVDALEWARNNPSSTDQEILRLRMLINPEKKLILITGHRRENLGTGFAEVVSALEEIAALKDVQIIFPVHLNPQVQSAVECLRAINNIHLVDPIGYSALLWLLEHCDLIISDSGGIQEEAPSFGKKVLVTREFTERPEGVEEGYSVITGCHRDKIVAEAVKILNVKDKQNKKGNPYGDGTAAQKIVQVLKDKIQD